MPEPSRQWSGPTTPDGDPVCFDPQSADYYVPVAPDGQRPLTDAERLHLARTTRSESGYGWTLDLWTPYFPGTPCSDCGKFVGRNGWFGVEHFEMSSTIASVEGTCRRCLEDAAERRADEAGER